MKIAGVNLDMSNVQTNLFVTEDTSDPSITLGNEEALNIENDDEASTDFTGMSSDSNLLEMLDKENSHYENRTNQTSNSILQDSVLHRISSDTPINTITPSTPRIESNSHQDDNLTIIAAQEPPSTNKHTVTNDNNNITTIDLDVEEQQVVEILDDEEDDLELKKSRKPPESYKPIREYKCPICFEPPERALITQCGHVFCCDCLFQMVNNSNPSRNLQNSYLGLCALCRSKVDLRTVVLLRMKRKQIQTSKEENK